MLPSQGEMIEFEFHGLGGVTSCEPAIVVGVNELIITVDSGFKFDARSGECLNDDSTGGCRRVINKRYL